MDFKINDGSVMCEYQRNNRYLKYLFILSIILIPFDNLPYCKEILGELSVRASVYIFCPIILFVFIINIKNKEIFMVKDKISYLLLIFLLWIFISSTININSIASNSFKERSGISKLVLQIFVMLFMYCIYYTSQFTLWYEKISLIQIRKYIMYSLIPVSVYSLFELINLMGILDLGWLLKSVSWLIHFYNRGIIYTKGIRSVTGEASYFAMYCAFVIPWIFSYIFTEKRMKDKIIYSCIFIYVITLLIFSKSRTGYGIMFIQLFLYSMAIFLFNTLKNNKKIIICFIVLIISFLIIVNVTVFRKVAGDPNSAQGISINSLYKSLTDKNNMSNVARLGMQKAAIRIGIDNPIFGVGIGQYGFYVPNYVDNDTLKSSEVQNWVNPKLVENYWPPSFSLYPRIIAEQGFVGFIIWISIILMLIMRTISKLLKSKNDILGISLLISFLGIILSNFNADTFTLVQFWIMVAVLIKYSNDPIKENVNE